MTSNGNHLSTQDHLDSPATSNARREVLRSRPVLNSIYQHWYEKLLSCIPNGPGRILEIGSGGGFLQDLCPTAIRTDFLPLDQIDVQLDVCTGLPFASFSLKAILGLNVFHHLSTPRSFFREVQRCLRPGGALILIDPWVTPWSRFIYRTFHHEPFEPDAQTWEFASSGPLSGANGALSHLVFSRDLSMFQKEFPHLRLVHQQALTPFSYALSGGFSHPEFIPEVLFAPLRKFEDRFPPARRHFGMFALNVLRHIPSDGHSFSDMAGTNRQAVAARLKHEKDHGMKLAGEAVEVTWGWGTPAGKQRAERRAGLIEEAARLRSCRRVLEIGCGSGEFTARWAPKTAHYLAIDVSTELLSLARKRLGHLPNVTFLCTSLEELSASQEGFDAIVGNSVLHHLDLGQSLPHLFSLLKPGGTLAFAEPNYLNPQVFLERFCRRLPRFRYVSPDETAFIRPLLKHRLQQTGFSTVHIFPFDWLHPGTPAPAIPFVSRLGQLLERLPMIQEFAGSLFLSAQRPE